MKRLIAPAVCLALAAASVSRAAVTAADVFEKASPSLVAVQYTWASELQRIDLTVPGVVVSEDGLVMMSIASFLPMIPEAQLVDFKVLVPSKDGDAAEYEATYQGRDERTNLAYAKLKENTAKLPAVKFEDKAAKLGDKVFSVGLLPKNAGFQPYVAESQVSGFLRGEIKQTLVTGAGLAAVGSPVFNIDGVAIGFVNLQRGKPFILDTSNEKAKQSLEPLMSIDDAPRLFTPAGEFTFSASDRPTAEKPVKLPWIGVPQLVGLRNEVTSALGLGKTAAVEIGDITPGSPGEQAGLKVGMKIVKVNGQPLERGDEPEELPMIMARKLARVKPGEAVTFTVFTAKDQPTQDIKVTLGERPRLASMAKRFYAEDLGFVAREVVFEDTYRRKLPMETKGVVVALVKASSSAQSAKLTAEDLVTSFNSTPVTDLPQFQKDYEAFRKEKANEPIVLVVAKRDGSTETIRIEPPR